MNEVGVVLPYWPGRPPLEALDVADAAAAAGVAALWIGEMATFDAFALAAVIATRQPALPITVGPLAVGVRDPVSLAMGVGSVAELGGRTPGLALGTSTPVVVEQWHGRSWSGATTRLRDTARDVRALLAGEKVHGFRLRVSAPEAHLTIAAFGARSIGVARECGDRMVTNLVTTAQARRLKAALGDELPLAAWLPVAVNPSEDTLVQLRQALVAYLAAPGYGEMLTDAGFGDLVSHARSGAHPRELFESIGIDLLDAVGAVGDVEHVRARLDEYRAAGVDHVAVVPGTVSDVAIVAS